MPEARIFNPASPEEVRRQGCARLKLLAPGGGESFQNRA